MTCVRARERERVLCWVHSFFANEIEMCEKDLNLKIDFSSFPRNQWILHEVCFAIVFKLSNARQLIDLAREKKKEIVQIEIEHLFVLSLHVNFILSNRFKSTNNNNLKLIFSFLSLFQSLIFISNASICSSIEG